MSANPRQATIAGVYLTRQAKTLPGRQSQELIIEAVKGALADAGLSPRDVDGVAIDWPGPGGAPGDSANWAPYFQQPIAWQDSALLDTAGVRGVLKAAAAIEMGLCDTVVIGSGRAGPYFTDGSAIGSDMNMEFADCYGSFVMAQFALVAQRHMHEFGTTPEQLAQVAVTLRNNGSINPEAAMFGAGPYTVADILASPMIASPLHRLDCCMVNEGGAALVLTTAERARDLRRKPVTILGGGMEFWRGHYANPPLYREMRALGQRAAQRTFSKADAKVEDVDVFCLYDPVGFEILRQFEMLGFCGEGEGGAFVDAGHIALNGRCPTNPDGGMLAASWTGTAQLTMKVIEGTRQLRGDVPANRQIADAELALISNAGSGAQHYELMLLGAA